MPRPTAADNHAPKEPNSLHQPAHRNGRAPQSTRLGQDHLNVLIALRQDCRIKHTDLARQQGWPVSTTHERMNRYAKHSVTRHTCLLDFKALGFPCRTIWIVKPQHREEWLANVRAINQINTLCRTHAGDFIAESVCRDSDEENVVRALLSKGALIISSHSVIDDIKTEAAFASAEALPVLAAQSAQIPARQ
jgi:DNA-binding Lrp family transcriptional regulator